MEKHRCKLCSRSFLNGRALGGHMRSHLATLPLPSRKSNQKVALKQGNLQLGDHTESDSSSTRSEDEHLVKEVGFYELRDNPKKSVKALLDPEFLEVQDRESETESTQNPTRRGRSKRPSQREGKGHKRCKWVVGSESATESTQVSSVSDPSQDEEVALSLIMLSRDAWERVGEVKVNVKEEKSIESRPELKTTSARPVAKFKCLECKKVFRTGRALAGHKASNKQCCQESYVGDQKIFECPFCSKVFGSGQALGGHKRSHLLGPSSTNNNTINVALNDDNSISANSNAGKVGDPTCFILDLNLPAPTEDNEDHTDNIDFVID